MDDILEPFNDLNISDMAQVATNFHFTTLYSAHKIFKYENEETKESLLRLLLQFCEFLKHEELEEQKRKAEITKKVPPQTQIFISLEETFYGRYVLKTKSEDPKAELNIKIGDNVGIKSDGIEIASGVVINSDINNVKIVVNNSQERNQLSMCEIEFTLRDNKYLSINAKLDSEYSRYVKAIMMYYHCSFFWSTKNLIDIIINIKEPSSPECRYIQNFHNHNLNEEQKQIVNFALNQREIALIQGPPGTGKTKILVEIILQELDCGRKVIACAPSNVAADNLAENLLKYTVSLIRLGHPGRQNPKLFKFSVNYKLDEFNKSGTFVDAKDIVGDYDIIISTLATTKSGGILDELNKPRVIAVDECCQATEALTWLPLHIASKLILAGDFHQLPPTIKTQKKEIKRQMEYSLMKKLHDRYNGNITRTLKVQYRMNHLIMKWSSLVFYDDKLVASDSVRNHLLIDMNNVSNNSITSNPLILVDTEFTMKEIGSNNYRNSKGNLGEAELVYKMILYLTRSGLKPEDIGVITPYKYQVELISQHLNGFKSIIEVASVDKFQGREKEVIILSMVRSNSRKEIGFLKESRRLNVAITRAKRLFLVICDTSTVCEDTTLLSFINFIRRYGTCFNAVQFTCIESN